MEVPSCSTKAKKKLLEIKEAPQNAPSLLYKIFKESKDLMTKYFFVQMIRASSPKFID